MNILIFSGGTGSVAIQRGLRRTYGDRLDVRIITNTQDNGKSTGTVRKVLDGKINGPSDLRKNQTLRYQLQGDANKELITLLDIRFDCSSSEAQDYCLSAINNCKTLDSLTTSTMIGAVRNYFAFPKSTQVDYVDFSLANIIYAGLAAPNFSLAEAGKIMARNVLQIPEDAVLVADDKSLYLQAHTHSGRVIVDEGDIVDWNNPSDKIIDTFFTDPHGKEAKGELTGECLNAIQDADVIIFSSGTQWSSLIPTYQHNHFKKAMKDAKAKKYLVVNNVQDKDMAGVGANEMLEILGTRFLDLQTITCIFNQKAMSDMQVDEVFMDAQHWRYLNEDLSLGEFDDKRVHDGSKLAKLIMFDYYGSKLTNDTFVFDYDDTLVGRNSTYHEASKENKELLMRCSAKKDISICTGNSIKAINFSDCHFTVPSFTIFAEGGVNRYRLISDGGGDTFMAMVRTMSAPEVIAPEFIFTQTEIDLIMSSLEEIGINLSKIQNRGNAIISIKPIDPEYRKPLAMLIRLILNKFTVRIAGRTTIDISLGGVKDMILGVIESERITVVGDESHEGGNDYSLAINPRVDFIAVKNPKDTNVFLLTLAMFLGSMRR